MNNAKQLLKSKLPPPQSKRNSYNSKAPGNNSLYVKTKVKKTKVNKNKKLPTPVLKKPIPNSFNSQSLTHDSQNVIETINVNENLFTLKELIDLNIDTDDTQKVFMNGITKYKITNSSILDQLKSGEWFKTDQEKQQDNFYQDAIDTVNVEENDQQDVDNFYAFQQDDNNYEEEYDNSTEVIEPDVINDIDLTYEYSNQLGAEVEYVNQNDNFDDYSLDQHLEQPINVEDQEYVDYGDENQNAYDNEYYDDLDESLDYVEHGNYEGYQQLPAANEVVANWNKKLWRTEDILYKVYNISYNQNHEDPNQGCLYNFSFDVFPGDRIAIMAHDSISDVLLMDILSNRVEKDSGYVFFNLKREQKWFDIYSHEYDGFDIELYNRRNEAIYQFQSPDYLAYATTKNDTISSTFKKIFNSVNYVINEQIYEDLLYLLDLENDLKTHINKLSELQKRKFIFMCDVLIGKKIILMINLTEGFDMPRKLAFYRYINALYQDSDTVLIFNVKDSIEVKLLASRLIIIDDGQAVVNKKLKDILNSFETLDTFIFDVFDRLHKKYLDQ